MDNLWPDLTSMLQQRAGADMEALRRASELTFATLKSLMTAESHSERRSELVERASGAVTELKSHFASLYTSIVWRDDEEAMRRGITPPQSSEDRERAFALRRFLRAHNKASLYRIVDLRSINVPKALAVWSRAASDLSDRIMSAVATETGSSTGAAGYGASGSIEHALEQKKLADLSLARTLMAQKRPDDPPMTLAEWLDAGDKISVAVQSAVIGSASQSVNMNDVIGYLLVDSKIMRVAKLAQDVAEVITLLTGIQALMKCQNWEDGTACAAAMRSQFMEWHHQAQVEIGRQDV